MQGGSGLIFTEFDVAPEVQGELKAWHSDEHVPERLAIADVRSARRFVSASDPHHYCCFYRADTAEVFVTPAYQALFANQSAATLRVTAGIKGSRFVGDIVREEGVGFGGLLHRNRIPAVGGPKATAWFDAKAADLLARPGVVRLTLAIPRPAMPNVTDANCLLFVEGFDDSDLASAGAELPFPGVTTHAFRLEHLFG
jgi:hypothetical protein